MYDPDPGMDITGSMGVNKTKKIKNKVSEIQADV